MTKIINTKKGMAKKTLSVSLAVAMLATSNVPVWAAEFSDGSEAAVVASELPVVEDAVDVVDVQAVNDTWTVKLTNMPTEAAWGSTGKNVTVEIKDVDEKDVSTTSGLKYVWMDAATGTSVGYEANITSTTIAIPDSVFAKENVGKSFYLYIYDESGDFEYKSQTVTVGAQDITNKYSIDVPDRYYTGKETEKNAKIVGGDVAFNVDYTGDLVNAGTVYVTAKPVDTKLYTGRLTASFKINKTPVSSDLTIASMATKAFAYTGKEVVLKPIDVTVLDKNTGAPLADLVDNVSANGATKTGDKYTATVNLKTPAENQNFTYGSTASINTTDTFKVVARDLSSVNVAIESNVKKQNGAAYTEEDFTEKNVKFTDAEGNELNLLDDVDIVVPAGVAAFGTYTFTIQPKKDNENVTGTTTAEFTICSQSIAKATFTGDGFNYATTAEEYTGSQITKDVNKLGKVVIGNETIDPADYEIQFGENVNAGTGTIVIVGKRTYEGSKAVITFTINPAKVSPDTITASEFVAYNKDAKAASDYADAANVVVKAKNGATPAQEFTLTEGTDYTVSYVYKSGGNVPYGIIYANITLKNPNFTGEGTLRKAINIADTFIKDADIKLAKDSYDYTGAVIVPEFEVVVDGKTLERGKDYNIVSIINSANVGTATITVQGIKGSGYDERNTAKATFEVLPVSADKVNVKLYSSFEYDGTAQKPEYGNISVTLDGNSVWDQFEIVSYGENINAGKEAGTVVLAPKKDNKNFVAGTTKTLTFDIAQAALHGTITVYNEKGIAYKELPSFEYDGTAKTFAKVVFTPDNVKGNKKLTTNDYEIVYVNNITGGGAKGASIAVIAKGNYKASGIVVDNASGKPVEIKNVAAEENFAINSKLYFTEKEVTVTNPGYAEGIAVKPVITVKDGAKTLVEGVDYTVTVNPSNAVNPGESGSWSVVGKGVYGNISAGKNEASGTWEVTKADVADLDVKVELNESAETVLTVMNGRIRVDNKNFDVKLSDDKKTATVSATVGNKYYVGSAEVAVGGETAFVGAPMISDVKVNGNKATVILSGDVEGAVGYDYVISTDRDCITNKDYDKVNKNILTTQTTFNYVQQGVYYAYCHAWKRDAEGKKVFGEWSNAYPFSVSAITPDQPVITSVKVSGSTVIVTYTQSANATGYDVVLGSAVKKVNGETRPVNYGTLVKKNVKGNVVTATFKNVPAGSYYAGLHAFNRTSENGTKVFSVWSNTKKVVVK